MEYLGPQSVQLIKAYLYLLSVTKFNSFIQFSQRAISELINFTAFFSLELSFIVKSL